MDVRPSRAGWRLRRLLHAGDHRLDEVFMLPSSDAAFCAGGALVFHRTDPAGGAPIYARGEISMLCCEAVGQAFAGGKAISLLIGVDRRGGQAPIHNLGSRERIAPQLRYGGIPCWTLFKDCADGDCCGFGCDRLECCGGYQSNGPSQLLRV